MKLLITILLLTFSFSFLSKNKKLFNDFHSIFEKADFKSMNKLLSNNFVYLNKDYEIISQKPDYITYMTGWNQVFNTKWNVISVKEIKDTIISIEYDTDLYNDYFYGSAKKIVEYTYIFKNNQISSIKSVTTFESLKSEIIFKERFYKFYQWVSINYPEKLQYCKSYDKIAAIETKQLLEKYLSTQKIKT